MKRLEIIRVTVNEAYVARADNFFRKVKVTDIMPYKSCVAYVMEHQEEAVIYKVAKIANRKNAKRRLVDRFLADDNNEAVSIFARRYCQNEDRAVMQLLTGDWKIIAERDGNGLIKII